MPCGRLIGGVGQDMGTPKELVCGARNGRVELTDAGALGARAAMGTVIDGVCSGSGAGSAGSFFSGSGSAGPASSTSNIKALTSFKCAANSLRAARPRSLVPAVSDINITVVFACPAPKGGGAGTGE